MRRSRSLLAPMRWLLTLVAAGCVCARAGQGRSEERVPPVITNSIGMRLVRLEAGEFIMGSPETEDGHAEDEQQHRVRLTRPFYLGQHEVTVGQFRQFVTQSRYVTRLEREPGAGFGFDTTTQSMEARPHFNWKNTGFSQSDNHPVVNVRWEDAVAFCRWLTQQEGHAYQLPTEAQWEYGCRAGTTSRFASGEEEESLQSMANVADASFLAKYADATWSVAWNDQHPFTAPAGSFRANAWGLHDMHGNVWEWCADWYGRDYYRQSPTDDPTGPAQGERRVLRGGAFTNRNKFVRSADRDSFRPKYRENFTGFRVVREIR